MDILLVEDNPGDVRLFRETLIEADAEQFVLANVDNLCDAKQRLMENVFDLILCDLTLPDSYGLLTFQTLHEFMPDIPIIVLSGLNDEALAVQAVKEGAQDYLVKGVDAHMLVRSMRYAIERHRMQESLRSLSLIDELTGINNRRGFLALAEQQLKFATRAKQSMLLVFADLDGMKVINDTLGHKMGDQALVRTAEILKSTLRDSDLVARIGGDEFVILAVDSLVHGADGLEKRVQQSIAESNATGNDQFRISLSLGVISFNPLHPRPLEEMLASADALMYEAKRAKKR